MSAISDLARLAATDPVAACARLVITAESCAAQELTSVATLTVQVHARLGRFRDGLAVLGRIMALPTASEPQIAKSLARAKVALLRLSGELAAAESLTGQSCIEPGDRPRLDALTAQAAAMAGRWGDATTWLTSAAQHCAGLGDHDPAREQVTLLARSIAQGIAANRHQLIAAADAAASLETAAANTPERRHAALHHRAHALLHAGRPDRAVALLDELLALEEQHALGVERSASTALLAAHAQTHRGMPRLAMAARDAAQAMSAQLTNEHRQHVEAQLAELDRLLAEGNAPPSGARAAVR